MGVGTYQLTGICKVRGDVLTIEISRYYSGGKQLTVAYHLIIVVVVVCSIGCQGVTQRVDLGQQCRDTVLNILVIRQQRRCYATVVILKLLPQFRGVHASARHQFLQKVGGLAHSRHHYHERLGTEMALNDAGHVAHSVGTIYRCASEFEHFHDSSLSISRRESLAFKVSRLS